MVIEERPKGNSVIFFLEVKEANELNEEERKNERSTNRCTYSQIDTL